MERTSPPTIKFPTLTVLQASTLIDGYSNHGSLDLTFQRKRNDISSRNPEITSFNLDMQAIAEIISGVCHEAMSWSTKLRARQDGIELTVIEITDISFIVDLRLGNRLYKDISVIFKNTPKLDTFMEKARGGFANFQQMKDCINQIPNRISYFEHISILTYIGKEPPEIKACSKVKYLDLSNARLPQVDLSPFASLEEAQLGCTAAPTNLPESLIKLTLNAWPLSLKRLELKKLPSKLELLDLSSNKDLEVEDGFWELLHTRTMTLVLARGMELPPVGNTDLSKITFKDQFGTAGRIVNGMVTFPEKISDVARPSIPVKLN